MDARELLGILDARERHWSGTWWLGLEAPDEDTLKIVLWLDVRGRRFEASSVMVCVTNLLAPAEIAEGIISNARATMLRRALQKGKTAP